MITEITDYLPTQKFDTLQQQALQAGYETIHFDDGKSYPNIAPAPRISLRELKITTGLNLIPGKYPPFFRHFKKGDNLPTYVHSDSGMGDYTLILYLNDENSSYGGTALWKHKETQNTGTVGDIALNIKVHADSYDEEKWEQLQLLQMVPNKLVIFDSVLYHSRYPKEVTEDRLLYVWVVNKA